MHLNGTTPYTVSSDGDESVAIAKLLLDEEDMGTVFTVRAHENDCMKLKVCIHSRFDQLYLNLTFYPAF